MATWLQGLTMAMGARRRLGEDVWRPQIIDSHFAYPDGFAAVMLARRTRSKCVITCHGSDLVKYPPLRWTGKMLRWALSQADRVIAVSPALRGEALKLGCPAARSVVLPNGVDCRLFEPRDRHECRRQLGLEAQGPLAVCVGGLDSNKNQGVLLRALAALGAGGGPQVRLALVGEGPRRKALQKLAGKLGVASRVIFAGQQEYSRVAVWMAAADWLVLASFREGWPTVYHEAMACGRPVITSGVAAARYAVCDQELGIVVRENTPHGLRRRLRRRRGEPSMPTRSAATRCGTTGGSGRRHT